MYSMDFTKMETTTTGTGSLTLTPSTGFPEFSDHPFFVDGVPFPYTIRNKSDLTPVEIGIGELSSSGTVLVRTTPIVTWSGTVIDDTSPSAISLAAGTYEVLCSNHANYSPKCQPYFANANVKSLICYHNGFPSGSDFALTESTLYCVPWPHAYIGQCDAFLIRSNSANARTRMALYSVGTDGEPGKVIVTTATEDVSGAGMKVLPFSGGSRIIPAGNYYIGILFYENTTQTGAGSLTITRINSSGTNVQLGSSTGEIANRVSYLTEASISGAPVIPDNPTVTYTYNANIPLFSMRAT